MATKPLTTEAIALTEKKMDMSLDDIIKMSSKTNVGKLKKPRVSNRSRNINGQQDRSLKMRQYMDSRSTVRQGVLAQKRSNFQGTRFPLVSDAARKTAVAPIRNGGFNRNRAVNWSRPRAAGQLRRQGNASIGRDGFKQPQPRQQQRQPHQPQQQRQPHQPQQQRQQPAQRGEMMLNQKPKTLDSLFANMKEQRMRAVTHTNNGGAVRGSVNQPRQPWLRGRFGNYRS